MADTQNEKLELAYTLFCDDVRLEVGNKLSYMGVFQTIIVPQMPVWLPKLAVVNHWRGDGVHLSEVRILLPDRQQALEDIAGHIKRFWEPRMRRSLLKHVDEHSGMQLKGIVLEALRLHRASIL